MHKVQLIIASAHNSRPKRDPHLLFEETPHQLGGGSGDWLVGGVSALDSTSSAAVAAASDAVAGAAAAVSQLSRLLRMTGGMTSGSIDCRPS